MDTETLYRARMGKAINSVLEQVIQMAKESKNSEELADDIAYMQNAIQEWRHHNNYLPCEEPPWEWTPAQFAKYLSESKANVYYASEESPEPPE